MKRVAIIVVSILLLLSIAVTVYVVVSLQKETGKKASQKTIALAPTLTLVPTSIPTVTPTTIPVKTAANQLPLCTGLSASPTSGRTPLTVHFIASGTDLNGTLKKFEFNYGDGQIQQIEKKMGDSGSLEIDHTYTAAGQFTAVLRIQDNNDSWSAPSSLCQLPITTTGSSVLAVSDGIGQPNLTPTVTPTPTVKVTGTITPTRTPTPTKVASASATPVTAPDVPVAGGFLPTLLVGLGGFLILSLGLLFAL